MGPLRDLRRKQPADVHFGGVGTGLGGGVIVDGNVVKGRKGFGGELGHVLIPYQSIPGSGVKPACNCGRTGDLESMCSLTAIEKTLLPYFLPAIPITNWARLRSAQGRKAGARYGGEGDAMCQDIFRVQAHALGLFFDEMINTFDPDALIVGGGAVETARNSSAGSSTRFAPACQSQREEQADIPLHVMPNGDTAGARGAAIQALQFARENNLGHLLQSFRSVNGPLRDYALISFSIALANKSISRGVV